mmetsp:Transcript_98844/g.316892  ORF Transcript_98844/g.316892 Transcript_98844/m.316892 type:complete len:299 (+) Transcript_98844:511-1407(+)
MCDLGPEQYLCGRDCFRHDSVSPHLDDHCHHGRGRGLLQSGFESWGEDGWRIVHLEKSAVSGAPGAPEPRAGRPPGSQRRGHTHGPDLQSEGIHQVLGPGHAVPQEQDAGQRLRRHDPDALRPLVAPGHGHRPAALLQRPGLPDRCRLRRLGRRLHAVLEGRPTPREAQRLLGAGGGRAVSHAPDGLDGRVGCALSEARRRRPQQDRVCPLVGGAGAHVVVLPLLSGLVHWLVRSHPSFRRGLHFAADQSARSRHLGAAAEAPARGGAPYAREDPRSLHLLQLSVSAGTRQGGDRGDA